MTLSRTESSLPWVWYGILGLFACSSTANASNLSATTTNFVHSQTGMVSCSAYVDPHEALLFLAIKRPNSNFYFGLRNASGPFIPIRHDNNSRYSPEPKISKGNITLIVWIDAVCCDDQGWYVCLARTFGGIGESNSGREKSSSALGLVTVLRRVSSLSVQSPTTLADQGMVSEGDDVTVSCTAVAGHHPGQWSLSWSLHREHGVVLSEPRDLGFVEDGATSETIAVARIPQGQITEGNTVLLFCWASALPSPIYNWSKDGQVTVLQGRPFRHASVLILKQVRGGRDDGIYRCTVTSDVTGGVSYLGSRTLIITVGESGSVQTNGKTVQPLNYTSRRSPRDVSDTEGWKYTHNRQSRKAARRPSEGSFKTPSMLDEATGQKVYDDHGNFLYLLFNTDAAVGFIVGLLLVILYMVLRAVLFYKVQMKMEAPPPPPPPQIEESIVEDPSAQRQPNVEFYSEIEAYPGMESSVDPKKYW